MANIERVEFEEGGHDLVVVHAENTPWWLTYFYRQADGEFRGAVSVVGYPMSGRWQVSSYRDSRFRTTRTLKDAHLHAVMLTVSEADRGGWGSAVLGDGCRAAGAYDGRSVVAPERAPEGRLADNARSGGRRWGNGRPRPDEAGQSEGRGVDGLPAIHPDDRPDHQSGRRRGEHAAPIRRP